MVDVSKPIQSWSPRAGCKRFGNLLNIFYVLDPELVLPRQQNSYVTIDASAVKRSAVEVSASFTPGPLVC
jgi:hypothetical protein